METDATQFRCSDCDELNIVDQKGFSFRKLPCMYCPGTSDTEIPESLNSKPPPWELKRSYSSRPKKQAVLIGVSYRNWKYKLKGTVNDVMRMRSFLMEKFDFLPENILVLTEDEPPELTPTKRNIERSMRWLVEDCKPGDSLVFFFSGHGLRQVDLANDELDAFDENICPVDFLQEGLISDNEINAAIVRPLPKGVTLHAIVDACHSGTVLDLAFVYSKETNKWDDNRPPSGAPKYTSGGLAISICACEDSEEAADTSAFTGNAMNGALTYVLVETVRNTDPRTLTYSYLLNSIDEAFHKANEDECFFRRFLRRVLGNQITQKPILSASEQFDVSKKKFVL